jgi:hypothetical protein
MILLRQAQPASEAAAEAELESGQTVIATADGQLAFSCAMAAD